MTKYIGREKDTEQINRLLLSEQAEFIAVYGRRRVGKTYLIDNMLQDKYAFSMTGIMDGNFTEQMHAFTDAMDNYGFAVDVIPSNWLDAFALLRKALAQKLADDTPCIIFIDELPCFDTPKAGFVKALGYFWNSWASKNDKIKMIVCGSATSWMIDHVINSKGSLHDRVTCEIHLHPFCLHEVELYLESRQFNWTRMMTLQTYMAFGGIPFYLSLLNREESLAQNIDRLFFKADGPLRMEYRRLFKTLFNKPEPYMQIVEALAQTKSGMTRKQIAEHLQIDSNGHLGDMLSDLIQCDFVRLYNIRDKKVSSRSGIYQLVDFFVLFHHQFNGKTSEHFWTENLNSPLINTWSGLAFERICLSHIPQILKSLRIDAISTEYYSWRCAAEKCETESLDLRGAQIDLIIERADRIINLCEIKFSESEHLLTKDEDMKMRNRINQFKLQTRTRCAIWPTFITTFGLAKGMYANSIPAQLTMDDLFKSLL